MGTARPFPRWGTFVAARSRSPSIQKCSELKPPEHSGRPTSNLSDGSRRDCPFHSSPLRFLRQCALFATVVAHVDARYHITLYPHVNHVNRKLEGHDARWYHLIAMKICSNMGRASCY